MSPSNLNKEHLGVVVIAIIAMVIIVFLIPKETTPPDYDLGDRYFNISTDRSIYNRGDTVTVTVNNVFNETMYLSYSGCEGNAFGVSKYEEVWKDFPAGCGFCKIQIVNEILEPGETKSYEWDQVVYLNPGPCEKAEAEPGTYRITVETTRGTRIKSYSKPFKIV